MESPVDNINFKPVHASTPNRNKRKDRKQETPLKILNVNFQSIKTKQCRLENLLESTKPDIVIGTETWLDPTITDNQIFPQKEGVS